MNISAKAVADALGPVLKTAFKVRDDRIADLEQRLAEIEKATSGEQPVEWPIPERKIA